ncbi:MAG: helix-turn-helix domain-containing protein [Caulobacteraceae bacterium]|nr:helix-turn-helix domain-containing protein [Caulobacteraceae bacterium]
MDAATQPVISSARQSFFGRGELPADQLPQPILRSWLRCAELGLDVESSPRIEPLSGASLREACERHERLRRLSRPELDALHSEAQATGGVVILTNGEGLLLDVVGDSGFAGRAAGVALRPGVVWSEASTGTNAIGAALAERRPVAVHGGEHYFEPHGMLSCAAAPILDPRGAVAGILDLSGHASVAHTHALGLVRMAVDQIEHRFFDEGFEDCDVLRTHTDPALLGAAREGILVFRDDRLVAANRRGLEMVAAGWDSLDRTAFGDLFLERLSRLDALAQLRAPDGRLLHARLCRAGRAGGQGAYHSPLGAAPSTPETAADIPSLRTVEAAVIEAALKAAGGNISLAARRLGVHRSTLYRHRAGKV